MANWVGIQDTDQHNPVKIVDSGARVAIAGGEHSLDD